MTLPALVSVAASAYCAGLNPENPIGRHSGAGRNPAIFIRMQFCQCVALCQYFDWTPAFAGVTKNAMLLNLKIAIANLCH
jgi:hypothetical protein